MTLGQAGAADAAQDSVTACRVLCAEPRHSPNPRARRDDMTTLSARLSMLVVAILCGFTLGACSNRSAGRALSDASLVDGRDSGDVGAPGSGGTGVICTVADDSCTSNGQCCSNVCDPVCCGGWCAKAQGATLGVCQDVQTTGAGSCTHDGVLCNGCGSCCSRNCGPWALTGVNVCQPGLGCKILNSLCTTDQECCGGD